MDSVREFLEGLKQSELAKGNLLGLLNILIGRRVRKADGGPVSAGLTWREAAAWLKKVRWRKEAAAELGANPSALSPRDRRRYWYQAIAQAGVDSPAASRAGDRLAAELRKAGYEVGPPPKP